MKTASTVYDYGVAIEQLNESSGQRDSTLVRGYFRALRAAELRAWEISGGDYLVSRDDLPESIMLPHRLAHFPDARETCREDD
jgi:hypothetical protein